MPGDLADVSCLRDGGNGGLVDGSGTAATVGDAGTSGSATTDAGTAGGMVDGSGTTTAVPIRCDDDNDCIDPAKPFCWAEACVGCSLTPDPDQTCALRDFDAPVCVLDQCVECSAANDSACPSDRPVCQADTNVCVQCTETAAAACDGTTPFCDTGTNTCVGCTEHAQCPESACDFRDGSCLDGMVLQVGPDEAHDYATPAAALAALEEGAVATLVIHPNANGYAYSGSLTIGGERTVALIAANGDRPVLQGQNLNPVLSVGSGAIVFVGGLRFEDANAVGLVIDAATAYVDQTEIVLNAGGAITVGGDGVLVLRNSAATSPENVAVVISAGTAEIVYSTLYTGNSRLALSCQAGATVSARNSIIVHGGEGDEIACEGAIVSFSLTQMELEGEGNVQTQIVARALFTDAPSGNFHLSAMGATEAAGVALRQAGDPSVDIDGEARPAVGEADHAGADVP